MQSFLYHLEISLPWLMHQSHAPEQVCMDLSVTSFVPTHCTTQLSYEQRVMTPCMATAQCSPFAHVLLLLLSFSSINSLSMHDATINSKNK
jgi:hypothetical protein